ncbi:MAG: protein kinase family protein [Muribaculaceae bacterium]|nr:protein kinase family protein [Muribaculaceae bacterium]
MDDDGCSNSALTVKLDDNDVNPRLSVTELRDLRLVRIHGAFAIYTAMRYGRKFLIKSLDTPYRDLPEWQRLLFKEFELGVRLDHPGIARTVAWENVPAVGESIVMEYVDGIELRDWLKTPKGRERKERREVLRQIADSLAYIHSKGISHRDLKPDNILVTHNGNNVKIIDFGLGDGDDFTVYKRAAGTKRFGAPEQQGQEAAETSMNADIYSFGKIMAMMRPGWRYRRLISKCLRKEAKDRPSAGEVLKVLNRKPRAVAITVAVSLAIGLAAAWVYIDNSKHTAEMKRLRQPAVVDTIYVQKTDTVRVEAPSKPSDSAIKAVWDKIIKDIDQRIEITMANDASDGEDQIHYIYESIPQWQEHLYYSLLGIGCDEETAQAKLKELDRYMRRRAEKYSATKSKAPADTLASDKLD